MHHTFRIYSRYREWFLRYYIYQASWTMIPVAGHLVRAVANLWGQKKQGAFMLTVREAEEIIDSAGLLMLGPCDCRATFHNCNNPLEAEILIGIGGTIFPKERSHDHYRSLTKEEARTMIRDFHSRGLVHTIIKCQGNYYAICNCCSCCCVPMRLSKKYGIGKALVRHPDIVAEFKSQLT